MKENEKKRAHELTGALLRVMEKPKDIFATVKTLLNGPVLIRSTL